MMNHRGYAQHASGPVGHFVGVGHAVSYTGSAVIALSGGVLAGDIAIADSVSGTNSDTLSVGIVNFGSNGRFSYEILNAGNQASQTISTVGTGSSCTTLIGVYRLPTLAVMTTNVFNDNTTSPPLTCPGFTKNVAAKSIAYFVGSPNNPSLLANPGTLRATTADGRLALADFDPASLYVDGTTEVWNYTSLANILMAALELR